MFQKMPFRLKKNKLTSMNWEITPRAYYKQIMELKNKYKNPEIHLTENGCAYEEKQ